MMRDLSSNAVASYLRQHGWEWTKLEPRGSDRMVWVAKDDDRRVLFVPTSSTSGDYGHRMSRVLAALESWEGRDQDVIVHDILSTQPVEGE